MMPQTDDQHLAHPALDVVHKIGVELHAVDGDDEVRFFQADFVKIDLDAPTGLTQQNHIVAGNYGDPHRLLCNAVGVQDFQLTLDRAAAMTSHSSQDKGVCPQLLQFLHHAFDDEGEIADSAAAYAKRDLHAGLYSGTNLLFGKFRPHGALHVGQTVLLKVLSDPVHGGKLPLGVFF